MRAACARYSALESLVALEVQPSLRRRGRFDDRPRELRWRYAGEGRHHFGPPMIDSLSPPQASRALRRPLVGIYSEVAFRKDVSSNIFPPKHRLSDFPLLASIVPTTRLRSDMKINVE